MVDKALSTLGDQLLISYDIACKLSVTIGSSSLSSRFLTKATKGYNRVEGRKRTLIWNR